MIFQPYRRQRRASYLEGHSPGSPLSSRSRPETTSPDRAGCTEPPSPRNDAARGCRSVCSLQKSAQKTHIKSHLGGLYRKAVICKHTNTSFSHLASSLTHLREAGLAVHDEIPVLRVQAVCHFVLPDECPVIRGRPASCVPSPRSLGDHTTHRLRHTQIHL